MRADLTMDRWFREIYKPFFIAAIFVALTVGATWGARLLWSIAQAGSFSAASLHEVNAHGEAQIFGWVGLFIMGFACQAFPRMWQTTLAGRSLVPLVFGLMIGGLVLRTVGMSMKESWDFALESALLGSALNVVAIWTFAAMVLATFERSRKRFEPYVGFILAAVAWLALSSVFSMAHTWATMTAANREELLFYVSTYQGALRHAQIHGAAMLMIIGVSLRIMPQLFQLPRISKLRQFIALALLTLGVAAEVSFFIAFRWTESPVLAACLYGSWVMLTAGVITIVSVWRPCRAFASVDRSTKFVRAAFLWLVISFGMLLLIPVHQMVSGLGFSHAYYGAIRHAITVGFVSMMIVGVGSKVIPALRGFNFNAAGASQFWGPFILLNTGCALRVITQTLTDFQPLFFKVIGVSGTLEVLALGWWGISMLVLLFRRGVERAELVRVSVDVPSIALQADKAAGACCSACACRVAPPAGRASAASVQPLPALSGQE